MKTLFAAAVLAAGLGTSAEAAVLVGTNYNFTASNFTAGPATSVSGSFTLNKIGANYSLMVLNLTIAGTQYSIANSGIYTYESQQVAIGANVNGVQGVAEGSNDFVLFFDPAAPQSNNTFYYTSATAGNSGTYFAGNVAVNVDAVPEPASWAMLVFGFGVAGAALRRRRTAVAFA